LASHWLALAFDAAGIFGLFGLCFEATRIELAIESSGVAQVEGVVRPEILRNHIL
jgi:hypothetical protein